MTQDTFVSARTDKYFSKTRRIIEKFGEKKVNYGVFQRRDVITATQRAIDFILEQYPEAQITKHFQDGSLVPSKTKILTIAGNFSKLVELETLFLQRLGFSQVSAFNAYQMSLALPNVAFIDMHGRHATGDDMVIAAAYGASIGSNSAKLQGAKGFIGTSNDLTAHFYSTKFGIGTMPHAVIGYAGTTLNSVKMYVQAVPEDTNIVALVDYFGKEITDSIEVAKWFYSEEGPKNKTLGVRLDTHGGRFLEGLTYEKSVEVVCKWLNIWPANEYAAVKRVLGAEAFDVASDDYIDRVRKLLFAQGVSAAAIIHTHKKLAKAGFPQVKIIASSGFDLFKCRIMGKANVPVDVVGTGSFLPKTLEETYSTADIFSYDGETSIKVGREWLIGG